MQFRGPKDTKVLKILLKMKKKLLKISDSYYSCDDNIGAQMYQNLMCVPLLICNGQNQALHTTQGVALSLSDSLTWFPCAIYFIH
jgi:hypothetical protein